MRKGSMTKEELDAYNQGLRSAYQWFDKEFGHLLERDTAAEPVDTWAYRGYGPLVGYCPSCGSYVEENFCGYCGKKLVWKGEKEPRPKREY